MRNITQQAGVNLAAINYHFGSKEVLIQEVFVRFLDPATDTLSKELSVLEEECQNSIPTVERVLKAFVSAARSIAQKAPDGVGLFMQLMGRSFTESQLGHLRKFLSSRYEQVLNGYKALLAKVLPHLTPETLFWRLHYTLGAVGFTLAGLSGLQKIAAREYADVASFDTHFERLISYVSGGLRV
jgi:AcrR family transcriptional regulator